MSAPSPLVGFFRRWWPLPLIIGASLAIQKLFFENRYDVNGHAAEHLSSATAPFLAAALIAVLLWTTPDALRQPDVLIASAAWLAATILVMVGNVQVVDDLVRTGLGDASTDRVDRADVDAPHDLANLAPWLAVVAVLVLTFVLWRRGHVSWRVAVGAGVLSVIFPPWIIPGAGIIVLVVARCIDRERALRAAEAAA